MTASVRNIRKLDGLPEARVVEGIEVERDIEVPMRGRRLNVLLDALQPGESFLHHGHGRGSFCRLRPKRFYSLQGPCENLRIPDGKWRIWRVA